MFEEVCEVRAVPAEGVDGCGGDVKAMGGGIMGGLVCMGSSIEVAIAVALGQWVPDGEIHEKAGLPE